MKRQETDPASDQFPKCSPHLEHTEIHRVTWEEKREEGVRGDPNEMRWNQKRREQASQ